jgi:hypothetical protein
VRCEAVAAVGKLGLPVSSFPDVVMADEMEVDVDVRLLPFALGSGLAPHFCCAFLLFAGGLARSHLR